MKKRYKLFQILLLFLFVSISYSQEESPVPINKVIYGAEQNYTEMCKELNSNSAYPRSLNTDGTIRIAQTWDWTSGFFPGALWYLYEHTGNELFKQNAISRTAPIANQRFNTGTHDLGFMLYCSFGNALRVTGDSDYHAILLDAANSLMSRYNPVVGCIRSWDFGSWEFPVIIDNMMNLELLFWATSYTDDSSYYHAAVDHAEATMKNHFRVDHSSYHVVDYNKATGAVLGKSTHQGYSDESDWARGQAWGLYGYTMCYKETGNSEFLSQAEKIANYYMNHSNLPDDKIPYWDFLAPGIPNEARDASAACVAASALLDLSTFSDFGDLYFSFAEQTLTALSGSEYFSFDNTDKNFLLKQSTGSKPSNSEVNTSIIYADYYYLEAIGRYRSMSDKLNSAYIISSEQLIVLTENTFKDNIIVYDIEDKDYTLSIVDDPGFLQISKVDNAHFEMLISPGANDAGTYEIQLLLSDASGEESIIKKQIYVEENIFPNLSVSASQYINDHLPAHTIDGNLNTYWESNENGSQLIYDLGAEFLIDTVSIAFIDGDSHRYSFSVFSSLDGVNWTIELYSTSSGTGLGFEDFGFQEGKKMRYIKIISYGSDIDGYSRFAELRFSQMEVTSSEQLGLNGDDQVKHMLIENSLVLRGSGGARILEVNIFNMLGSHLIGHAMLSPVEELSLPLYELEPGFYIAHVLLATSELRAVKIQIR